MRFRQWLEYYTSFEDLPPELQQLKHVYWYLRKNAVNKSDNPGYIAAYIYDFLKNKVASLKLADGQLKGQAHQFNILGSDDNKWLIDGSAYQKDWSKPFSVLGANLPASIVKKLTDAKLHTVGDVIMALDSESGLSHKYTSFSHKLPLNDIEKKTLRDALLPCMLIIRPLKGLQTHTRVINPRFDPKLPGGELHLGD